MGPPLPSKRLGVRTGGESSSGATSTVEVFVDFCCPFSRKMFNTLKEVIPMFRSRVDIVYMPMPQPWHPSSSVVHECYHAAVMAKPDAEMDLFDLTFDQALEKFGDVPSVDKSRLQMHKEWAVIYASVGVDTGTFLANLALPEGQGPNPGVPATQTLKFYIKAGRQLSMHVTPSIRLNSIACDSSSSWTVEDWKTFLEASC